MSAQSLILGAPYAQALSASGDANNCMLGVYLCNGDAAHLPSAATYYLLAHKIGSDRVLQYATRANDGAVYTRCNNNGTWTSWSRIDNYGTTSLEGLASAILGQATDFPSNADMNNYKTPGIYRTYNNTIANTIINGPASLGGRAYTMVVIPGIQGGRAVQIILVNAFASGNTSIYVRSYSTSWSGWYSLETTSDSAS